MYTYIVDIAVPVVTVAWEVNVYIVIEFCYQLNVLREVDQFDTLETCDSCIEQQQIKGDGLTRRSQTRQLVSSNRDLVVFPFC